jgi:misacylated tRNA(Ala) deacylase
MEPQFNEHNKTEFPPAHTAEHILNRTMDNIYHCGRSSEAHIERKKSKCDYRLDNEPTDKEIHHIENVVNEVIGRDLPVTYELTTKEKAADEFNLDRLPDGSSDDLRIVRVGDYDACPCLGLHVEHTSQIGKFKINSYTYENGILRLRWKVEQ